VLIIYLFTRKSPCKKYIDGKLIFVLRSPDGVIEGLDVQIIVKTLFSIFLNFLKPSDLFKYHQV